MKQRLSVTAAFKRAAVSRIAAGEPIGAVAADLGINRQRLYDWQEIVREKGLEGLQGLGRPRKSRLEVLPVRSAILNEGAAARRRIAELERKIGEQQADLDFFRQALRHVKARQQAAGASGAQRSTKSSGR